MRVTPVRARSLDDLGDRQVLDAARARGQVPGIARAVGLADGGHRLATLGMDKQDRPEIAQDGKCIAHLAGIQRREVRRAGIREEAFEAEYACLVERFEAAQVAGNDAAPEAHVDVALPVGCASLDGERFSSDGCRDAVERHVHQGRDAAGRGGPCRRREALPLGVARLAQVNMGVDEARQHDDVRTQLKHCPRGGWCVQGLESLDAAIADCDGPGLLRLASLTGHDTLSTYEEAHGAGRRGCCSPLTTLGTSSISRIVYGFSGRSKTRLTGPCSTTFPWDNTVTVWAMERTRARLWVMNRRDRCRSACRRRRSSTIVACTDTSRAEVISSQTRRSGETTRALAIATRWRSPPESWSG